MDWRRTLCVFSLLVTGLGVPVVYGQDATVWDGVFTAEQAARGNALARENCSRCHGANLDGTADGRSLTGDQFWASWTEATVGSLFDYVSRNMPYSMDGSREGSLSEATYIDIVARILDANGLPAGEAELTREVTPGIVIVPEGGPGELPASTLAQVVGCLDQSAAGQWLLRQATRPVRADSAPEPTATMPLGSREVALMFVLTPLDRYRGYRMVARGLLIGDGGADGLNVTTVEPVAEACE
jgi:Cytochrome C oxidase, cbb3-type, subunit III